MIVVGIALLPRSGPCLCASLPFRAAPGIAGDAISSRRQDLATDDVTRKTGVGNLSPVYRPLLGRVRKRLDDVPPLLTRVDRSGRVIVDSSRIASDDRPDSRVDKPRTGTVRGGSGMAAADALRVDVPCGR